MSERVHDGTLFHQDGGGTLHQESPIADQKSHCDLSEGISELSNHHFLQYSVYDSDIYSWMLYRERKGQPRYYMPRASCCSHSNFQIRPKNKISCF